MSYLNALGKRFAGSGIEELAIASGLIAPGSIQKAITGKHYNRAMRLHKLTAEALLQILLENVVEEDNSILNDVKQIVELKSEQEHEDFAQSEAFKTFVDKLFQKVSDSDSDMAKFWLSYIQDVEILFQHYHCIRSGASFSEYISSCRNMLPLLAAYGNINYVRFLSLYYWKMSILPEDQKAKMASIYSISLSGKSYSKLAPDQVIEMTMNKQSKNRKSGGWINFTNNHTMIEINILSRPAVKCLREQLLKITLLQRNDDYHPEIGPSRKRKDLDVIN